MSSTNLPFLPFRRRGILVALLLGFAGAAVQAGEEDVYFLDVPVVLSSSRLAQASNESPNFVTVIDREMIRASGAREVADLMRLVPGFQVTSRNFSTSARVSYHGLSDQDFSPRLQVLIDGRSQFSPLFNGGVNWDVLPVAIEDIERIEVIRGSNVAAYGANAFMGVVNIITQDASQLSGAKVSAAMGSQGVRDETVRYGGAIGAANLRMTYQQQADNGVIRQGDPWGNGQDKRLFDLRVDLPLSVEDELRFALGKLEARKQIGRSDDVTDPLRTATLSSQFVDLRWRRAQADGEEVSIRLSATEDRLADRFLTDLSSVGGIANDTLDFGGHAARQELELQHVRPLTSSTRLLWGANVQTQSVTSPYNYYAGTQSRSLDRLFAHVEWRPVSTLLVNVGASSDNDSLSGNHFSPRLAMSYHLHPDHTLRMGVSRAFRMPTMYERLGYQVYGASGIPVAAQTIYQAGTNVQAEELITQEIGYFGEFRALRASLDVRAFDEHIPNRIRMIERPTQDGDYAVNAEDVRVQGVEYQLRWQPQPSTRLVVGQVFAQVSGRWADDPASWTHWDSTLLGRANWQTVNSMPKSTTNFMWMQRLPQDLDFSLMLSQQDDMKWTGSTLVKGYTRADWRIAKSFTMGRQRGEIAYVVQSEQGRHLELDAEAYVDRRDWITLRLEL